jgi:hypothetical protein
MGKLTTELQTSQVMQYLGFPTLAQLNTPFAVGAPDSDHAATSATECQGSRIATSPWPLALIPNYIHSRQSKVQNLPRLGTLLVLVPSFSWAALVKAGDPPHEVTLIQLVAVLY